MGNEHSQYGSLDANQPQQKRKREALGSVSVVRGDSKTSMTAAPLESRHSNLSLRSSGSGSSSSMENYEVRATPSPLSKTPSPPARAETHPQSQQQKAIPVAESKDLIVF